MNDFSVSDLILLLGILTNGIVLFKPLINLNSTITRLEEDLKNMEKIHQENIKRIDSHLSVHDSQIFNMKGN